jgi:hypothetical protein
VGYRRFTDPEGNEWEVRDFSKWHGSFIPSRTTGQIYPDRSAGYESDPFEMSEEELQRLLGRSGAPGAPVLPSRRFKD